MFKIKLNYKTGGSFHSEDVEDYLDLEFKDLKVAEENLERIKNHYEYSNQNSDRWNKPKGKLPKGVIWDNEYRSLVLETIDDDGNKFTEWPSWVGHFERLYKAQVVYEGKEYSPHGY